MSDECIKEYYSRLYGHEWSIDRSSLTSAMQSDGMMQCDVDSDDINIPFASYSNEFRMISGGGLSIFVPYINEESSQMYDNLKLGTVPDKHARRIIEEYSCQLYKNQIDKLMQQHAVEFVNNSIWCLASPSYYDKNYGITFDSQGYTMF